MRATAAPRRPAFQNGRPNYDGTIFFAGIAPRGLSSTTTDADLNAAIAAFFAGAQLDKGPVQDSTIDQDELDLIRGAFARGLGWQQCGVSDAGSSASVSDDFSPPRITAWGSRLFNPEDVRFAAVSGPIMLAATAPENEVPGHDTMCEARAQIT